MKTLVLFFTLLSTTIAKPATLEDNIEGFKPTQQIIPETKIREKKAPVFNNIRQNKIAESDNFSIDSSSTTGLSVSPPEERSLIGFKKPIIIKKKVGYSVYRDSDEEKAQADPKEKCKEQVKVKLCEDESETNSHQMRGDVTFETKHDLMPNDEMKHTIKMAKEAVKKLQTDLQIMEKGVTTSAKAQEKSYKTDTDTELHKDIEVARQVLDHIHKNFGNLESMSLHATTLNDEEFGNIESKNSQWKETINKIQKNVDVGRNIEDRFKTENIEKDDVINGDSHKVGKNDIDEDPAKQNKNPSTESSETILAWDSPSNKVEGNHLENRFTNEKLQNENKISKIDESDLEMSITKDINSKTKLHSDNLRMEQGSNINSVPENQDQLRLSKSTNSLFSPEENNLEKKLNDRKEKSSKLTDDKTENAKKKIESSNFKFVEEIADEKLKNSHSGQEIIKRESSDTILKNIKINEENIVEKRNHESNGDVHDDMFQNFLTSKHLKSIQPDTHLLHEHHDALNNLNGMRIQKSNDEEGDTGVNSEVSKTNNDSLHSITDQIHDDTTQKSVSQLNEKKLQNQDTTTRESSLNMMSSPTNELLKENRQEQSNSFLPRFVQGNKMQTLQDMETTEKNDHNRATQPLFNDHSQTIMKAGKEHISKTENTNVDMLKIHKNDNERNAANEVINMRWTQNDNALHQQNMRNDVSAKYEHLKKGTPFEEHFHHMPAMRRNSHSDFLLKNLETQVPNEMRQFESHLPNGRFNYERNKEQSSRTGADINSSHDLNIPRAHHISSDMTPVHSMFHPEKISDMDSVVQASEHMDMREAMQKSDAEYAQQWFTNRGMARGASYVQPQSNMQSQVNTGSGAVGLFPNANTGGCAIPLLLSCSPSVVTGTLAKSHSSYSTPYSPPSYRSMDNFRYFNKRDTKLSDRKLIINPKTITQIKAKGVYDNKCDIMDK